jgi:ELWxxDGT repeat protein
MPTRDRPRFFRRRPVLAVLLVATTVLLTIPDSALADPPKLLEDINPTGDSQPYDLTNVDGTVFFAANKTGTDATYFELWKTDGTPLGTKRVKKTGYTDAQNLTRVGHILYFVSTAGTKGYELWKSNGTAIGTRRVKDINPSGDSSPQFLTNVGGRVFFSANGGAGNELWKSDGTAAGTRRE